MTASHPEPLPLTLIAEYLDGSADANSFWDDWVSVLLENPRFAASFHRLLGLSEEFSLPQLSRVAYEGPEARELLQRLRCLPPARQWREARNASWVVNWCLVRLLLRENLRITPQDVHEGGRLARLALMLVRRLPAAVYGTERLAELRALAWANLANVYRVRGDLKQADALMQRALRRLGGEPLQEPGLRADLHLIQGSMLYDQRQLGAARMAFEQGLNLCQHPLRQETAAMLQMRLAALDYEVAHLDSAIERTEAALRLIGKSGATRLFVQASFNLADLFARAGRFDEAMAQLSQHRQALQVYGTPSDQCRANWCEGIIHQGLGEFGAAVKCYARAKKAFLSLDLWYDAAIVTLELASLLLEHGKTAEVKQLALDTHKLFEIQDVDREALAALELFREAATQEALSIEMLQRIEADFRQACRVSA